MKAPHYLQHRKRLRERFERAGAEGLHDYELLELLLTYAVPRRDVKPAAKNLIGRFGSLAGVFDASRGELETVEGVGPFSAALVRLVRELFSAYAEEEAIRRKPLSSPSAVAGFAKVKLAGLPHENFMVIFLNVKNEVIDYEIIHEGTVDRAVVYPRRILESALARHAAGLILVHNHPSGHPEPSAEDRSITRSIADAGRTLDIRVVDHVVVGREGYFSFAEKNLL
jgi:DNA repair protein RadC